MARRGHGGTRAQPNRAHLIIFRSGGGSGARALNVRGRRRTVGQENLFSSIYLLILKVFGGKKKHTHAQKKRGKKLIKRLNALVFQIT